MLVRVLFLREIFLVFQVYVKIIIRNSVSSPLNIKVERIASNQRLSRFATFSFCSESDSSDDEDSESDDNDKAGDQWNLSDFMPKIEKPPSEPILNPDPVPKVETSNGYDRNPEIVKSPTPPRSEPIASIKKTSSRLLVILFVFLRVFFLL